MKEYNTKNLYARYKDLQKAKSNLSSYKTQEEMIDRVSGAKIALHAELDKLNAIIAGEEGRAKERRIDARMVCEAIEQIEDRLSLPKKRMEGIVAEVDMNAQDFPSAYKWKAQSTRFRMEYRKGSWRILSIYRADCRREKARYMLNLTEDARQAILERHTVFC
jgi:hypothetical protein